METSSDVRGMRGVLWTATLVSVAFIVPGWASAACIQVNEVTPEWYFRGTRCNDPGQIVRQGAYTTHDDKATLNGTVTRTASHGTVSIQKSGQLMSPSFEGSTNADATISAATGQVSSYSTYSGIWPLEKLAGELSINVYNGQVSVQDNRQPIP